MATTPPTERQRRRRRWLIGFALFALALMLSIWWFDPAPPRQLVLSTGEPEGIYAQLGEHYQTEMGTLGLPVHSIPSHGSMENLRRLLHGEADIAFVQGGVYPLVDDPKSVLRALVVVQLEPIWIFAQDGSVTDLDDLRGKSISIGERDSGTEALAQTLLAVTGIDSANATLVNLGMAATRDALVAGEVDVGIFVTSTHNPLVHQLLAEETIQLISFRRSVAYSKRFPFLIPVVLAEGVIDLERNLPGADIALLAVPTVLVARQDLHPRAVEQLLIAARKLHAKPPLLSTSQRFPSLEGIDEELPIHDTAVAYTQTGESFIARHLPYWAVWMVFKLKILLLPLILLALPFLRILPLLYHFRVNRLLRRHYRALRDLEDQVDDSQDPSEIQEHIVILDRLHKDMEGISRKVPTHLQIHVYQWRLHVKHVRKEANDKLRQLQVNGRGPIA